MFFIDQKRTFSGIDSYVKHHPHPHSRHHVENETQAQKAQEAQKGEDVLLGNYKGQRELCLLCFLLFDGFVLTVHCVIACVHVQGGVWPLL